MINVDKVTKKFDDFTALDEMTLNVKSGSAYGLLGSNGAGKSTLLRILAGIYKQDKGSVTIDGNTIYDNVEVKQKVFYVSDDVEYVVTEALRSIPRESRFHACMADVINWHKQYPEDWKKCWEEIEKKWGSNDIACPDGVEMPFNIETYVNGAYIILGLLYGQGDFEKTIDISTRAGQD